jgi:hypothetical protein
MVNTIQSNSQSLTIAINKEHNEETIEEDFLVFNEHNFKSK